LTLPTVRIIGCACTPDGNSSASEIKANRYTNEMLALAR
jgi:hypothetical protein